MSFFKVKEDFFYEIKKENFRINDDCNGIDV